MSLTSQTDDELKGIQRHLWVWLPLSGIILVLLTQLMKSQDSAAEAGFESLTQAFAQSITLIHMRWVQQNKPNSIEWEYQISPHAPSSANTRQYRTVTLNKNGWPVVNSASLSLTQRCEQIWHTILPSPLSVNKQPVKVTSKVKNGHWVGCNYRFLELSFNYWINTGRVEISN